MRGLSWKHPGMPELLRCADGENVPRISDHLKRCKQCREQVTLIASATSKAVPETRHTLNDIYTRIEEQMNGWSSSATPRLSAALEFYFGIELAQRIDCDRTVVAATQPLFRTFLGRRAADVLAQKLTSART